MIKALPIVLSAVVMAFGLFFCKKTSEKNGKADIQQAVPTPEINEYPYLRLIMTDGSVRTARELPTKSVLLIYFPDCDHCQREAKEISSHAAAFESYQVYFISTAPFTDIERFAKDYKLTGYANIHFVRTEMPDVVNNFGAIPTPSVYVYSSEKKLIKAFKGETKIEEIIVHL